MSRQTDVLLMNSVIDMVSRCREQRLEEYTELVRKDEENPDPVHRDLRLKKAGAIDELRNIRNILKQVIDDNT